jgi:hypothetical protein
VAGTHELALAPDRVAAAYEMVAASTVKQNRLKVATLSTA